MRIVLLGYMGSGKTTVGKLLAKQLKLQFFDLDQYIEEKEERTVADIFGDLGELYFRNREHRYLAELLEGKDDFVLSVGGGTPCYGNNLEVILKSTENVFYLKVPIEQLTKRLSKQKAQRPLVSHIADEELPEFIGKHIFERSRFYHQAHITIDTGDKDPEFIVADIESKLKKGFK